MAPVAHDRRTRLTDAATQGPAVLLSPLDDADDQFNPVNPNKQIDEFRDYGKTPRRVIVENTYRLMRAQQTYDFVLRKRAEWGRFDHARMSIFDALTKLDGFVDASDPDTNLPNSMHAFQTAEMVRQEHPEHDWMALVGLIHDVGKMLAVWGEPQWAVVGDTFPVGCAFDRDACVYGAFFDANPDTRDPRYNTRLGVYEPNCGLSQVIMSWGHDGPCRRAARAHPAVRAARADTARATEYMYQVLRHAPQCRIPEEGLYMVRFHSFYPWHTGINGRRGYDYLCSDHDRAMLPWVREFNRFDLYSKADSVPDVPALLPYYQSLADKYLPGDLCW